MMDPVTFLSSIPTLVEMYKIRINGLKTMKDTSEDGPILLYKIPNLETLRSRLNSDKQEEILLPSFPLPEMPNHIKRMQKRMEDISKKLEVPDHRFGKLHMAVEWLFTEKEVKEQLSELEQDKSLLDLVVQGDHL